MKTLVRVFLISCCFLVMITTMARDDNKFPANGTLQQKGALPDDRNTAQQNDLPADVTLQEDVLLWLRNYVKKIGNHAMYYHLMGRGYVFHGKYPEAIRYLKQADSAFRCPIPEYLLMTKTARFWQAKQLGDIARAYRFWGFYDSAMVYHRRSLAGFLQSGMPLPDVDAANQCEGIGLIYTFRGLYDSARYYLVLSKKMREYNSDWLGVGACYDGLGQISYLLGNYGEALRYLHDAMTFKLRVRKNKYPPVVVSYKESLGFTHLLLGKVYADRGFMETALREFNASLSLCRAIGFVSGETDAFNEIGKLYLKTGQYDRASEEFEEAMGLCKAAGDKPGEAVVLKYRGDLFFIVGKFEKALREYFGAGSLVEKSGNPVEQADLNLRIGKTLLLLGRQEEARIYLDEAIAVAEKLKLQQTAVEAQVELSGLFERMGRTGEALVLFKKVVSIREFQSRQKEGLILTDMDARHHADQNVLNILLITKDKQIKELKIRKFNYFLALAGGLTFMVVVLLILFLRSNKMKTDYRLALVQHRMFSSQLNPQVVYRGLNDITDYLSRSELEPAAKYLSHFSRFLQTTLFGSQKEFMPLEKEMIQVVNYLDLQQLCHPGVFGFRVIPPVEYAPEELAIAPFLIQPFLEKAVRAVTENRPGNGSISVRFQITGNILVVTLDHNGLRPGTKHPLNASVDDIYQQALSLAGERLALLWKKKRKTNFVRFSLIQDPVSGEQLSRIQMELPVIRI